MSGQAHRSRQRPQGRWRSVAAPPQQGHVGRVIRSWPSRNSCVKGQPEPVGEGLLAMGRGIRWGIGSLISVFPQFHLNHGNSLGFTKVLPPVHLENAVTCPHGAGWRPDQKRTGNPMGFKRKETLKAVSHSSPSARLPKSLGWGTRGSVFPSKECGEGQFQGMLHRRGGGVLLLALARQGEFP